LADVFDNQADAEWRAEPLRDPGYFARVFLEDGAPTWPNSFDMDPEWLRREIEATGGLTRDAAA
jgi:hypothetical protein